MYWECRTTHKCECLEDTVGAVHIVDVRGYKVTMEREVTERSYKTWHAVVSEYHKRSLTFASDFLLALSGVVTHFQSGHSLLLFGDYDEHADFIQLGAVKLYSGTA
jgi:hypothetical protein